MTELPLGNPLKKGGADPLWASAFQSNHDALQRFCPPPGQKIEQAFVCHERSELPFGEQGQCQPGDSASDGKELRTAPYRESASESQQGGRDNQRIQVLSSDPEKRKIAEASTDGSGKDSLHESRSGI